MPPSNTYPTPQASFDPTQPIQKPKKHLNSLLIPLILAVLFLLVAMGFGAWAFTERQDYKNNVDGKIAQAVTVAEEKKNKEKEAEFEQREKEPFKTFEGPATFGSVKLTYPKTWSAFVTQSDKAGTPIDGYFHPNVVPGLDSGTAFALHMQVTNTTYDQELKKFDADAKAGRVKVSAITVPGVPNVAGVRIDGEIEKGKQGSMVLFPLRDKTLKVSTQSIEFAKDFNETILANLTFTP